MLKSIFNLSGGVTPATHKPSLKYQVVILGLGKNSPLTFTTRNLPQMRGGPCGCSVWPALSPLFHKGCSLERVVHFLDPSWNSYSLSKSNLKQLFTLSTPPKWRQWKVREGSSTELSNPHEARKTFASFLCVDYFFFFFLLLMVCCILSKNRHELCGGRSMFTENHFSSYQMTQLCFIM